MKRIGFGGRAISTLFVVATFSPAVDAAEPIFPEPFHLTRSVEDPISGRTTIVEEYYAGNRVISVQGDRISIADHGAGTLTEIDRAAGTWSRATFAEIAAATGKINPEAPRTGMTERIREARIEARAARGVAGRTASVWRTEFPADHPGGLRSVEVAVDPSVTLTDGAAEILSGSAFPNRPGDVSRAILRSIDRAPASVEATPSSIGSSSLPVEQIVTWDVDGEEIRLVNRVTRMSSEAIDPALLAIPDDAIEVENHLVKMQRLLDELDRLPGVPSSGDDR